MEKIRKFKEKILDKFKLFGFKVGFFETIDIVLRNTFLSKYVHKTKHKVVKDYLKKEFKEYIRNYSYVENNEKIKRNCNIWIFWWQGIDQAPEVVKKCIESIERHSKKHSIVIIDKNNYTQYTQIPDYIIDKVNEGSISLTSFSDIIRMDLLYLHGGIWMDSTLFMSKSFDEEMYNNTLYTVKHNLYCDWHVCKGKWSGFFLASNKNNSSINFFRGFFFEYLKKYDSFITYFLIDCVIGIGYEEIDKIRKEIDNVLINSTKIFELSNDMVEKDADYLESLNYIKECGLHKLSYKLNYKKGEEKNKSLYDLFLENNLC